MGCVVRYRPGSGRSSIAAQFTRIDAADKGDSFGSLRRLGYVAMELPMAAKKTEAKVSASTNKATAKPAAKTAKAAAKPAAPKAATAKPAAPKTADLGQGDKAPSFSLPDETGVTVSSASLAGKQYVIYF